MNPIVVEAIGFAAFLTNVLGNWLLAVKSERGWLVRIVSIVLWGVYGWKTASFAMMANAVTFFGINCYGYRKWRKDAREAKWFEEQRRAA